MVSSGGSDLELSEYLQSFLTEERRERFDRVLEQRTHWIQVGLVDLYQQHNASAVLRTCDAMGVQKVHVVESYNEFDPNPDVALGSEQWLTLTHYQGADAVEQCVTTLKSQGVCVAATVLHADSRPIAELPLDRPVALLFGNERDGLPQSVIEAADELVHVPMYGFVESFNISVAAALCLQTLTERLRASEILWLLTPEEKVRLQLEWTRKSLKKVDQLERQFHLDMAQGRRPRRLTDHEPLSSERGLL